MTWPWRTQASLLAEQLAKAEARAEAAELALAKERRERMDDVRHVLSMWLRHAKTYPLPATADEKAAAKAEQANKPPPPLSPDMLARREAVRQWAKANGYTEREADEKFAESMHLMMEDE